MSSGPKDAGGGIDSSLGDAGLTDADAGPDADVKSDAGPDADLGDAGLDAGDVESDGGPPCPATCGPHATCDAATHTCVCDAGWMQSGTECVNACAAAGACDPFALCESLTSGVRCTCLPGLIGDGHTCASPQVLVLGDLTSLPSMQHVLAPELAAGTMTNDTATFTTKLGDGTPWTPS